MQSHLFCCSAHLCIKSAGTVSFFYIWLKCCLSRSQGWMWKLPRATHTTLALPSPQLARGFEPSLPADPRTHETWNSSQRVHHGSSCTRFVRTWKKPHRIERYSSLARPFLCNFLCSFSESTHHNQRLLSASRTPLHFPAGFLGGLRASSKIWCS